MQEELILQMLKEIRDDQKTIMSRLTRIDTDLEISRNGYKPHEIVALLHYVDDLKKREENRNKTIVRSVINWVVPMLLSSLVIGIGFYLH